jgi:LDH2 family malate/lactate/ureidoglycolate dehydrogenase
VGHFPFADTFAARVQDQAVRVSGSKRVPGVDRIYAPGELAHTTRLANNGVCVLGRQTRDGLIAAAQKAGLKNSNSILDQ